MKKLFLLGALVYVGQMFGMEAENPYGELPKKLKQEIINKTLATSTNLTETINAIKNASILHNIRYDNATLIRLLTKKFPEKVKEEIILAIEKPEIYQKVFATLKRSPQPKIHLLTILGFIERENILQDNLEDYTALMHMCADKFQTTINSFAIYLHSPIAKEYSKLSTDLLYTSDLTEAMQLLEKGADINYSGTIAHYNQYNVDSQNWYFTPLSKAAYGGNVDLVKLLLNAGANPFLEIPGFGTALDITLYTLDTLTDLKYSQNPNPKHIESLKIIKDLLENAMQKYQQ